MTERGQAYARSAFDGEIRDLAGTTAGRNAKLNATSFRLGQFVAAGLLDRGQVEDALFAAAQANGHVGKRGVSVTRGTMASGIGKGVLEPVHVPEGATPFKVDRASIPTSSPAKATKPPAATTGVPVPDWTDPGKARAHPFYGAGQPEPSRMVGEMRRHRYRRGGLIVRVKVKIDAKPKPTWTTSYLVRRPKDGAIGWQNKQPVAFVPCPYVGPEGITDPFSGSGDIWWLEGEKDVDTARAAGVDAFCFGGAGDAVDCASLVAGRDVIVCNDADEAGRKGIAKKVDAVKGAARSVAVVTFDGEPDGFDVTDFVERGGTMADLRATVRSSHECGADDGSPNDERITHANVRDIRDGSPYASTLDARPVIQLAVGDLARMVDETEAAIIAADLGVYQRGNRIVATGIVPVITADRREVPSQQIVQIGDHAMMEAAMRSARYEKWNQREKGFRRCDVPPMVTKTLEQRIGRWRFPVLAGIVNAPTLRLDGTILDVPGYDEATGLLFDPAGVVFPKIRPDPRREHAEKALRRIGEIIADFPFATDAHRSVALSAILTACVRRSLRTAPLHGFSAPVAGSGKSKLVDIASVISTGREAGVVAMGKNPEELEKRLVSLLLGGYAIAIDNVEGQLNSDLLCQILSQTMVRPRILGKSEVPEAPTNVLVTATGNNLVIAGDMTRRSILCRLDPKLERPELRQFGFEPVTRAKDDRGLLFAAAMTILRAYHVAGRPVRSQVLGSFEDWSLLVRDALIWLGCADPVATMEQARDDDPRKQQLKAVVIEWGCVIGSEAMTARQACDRASEREPGGYEHQGKPAFAHTAFRDALLSVAGNGGFLEPNKLSYWLKRNREKREQGCYFDVDGETHGTARWVLRPDN